MDDKHGQKTTMKPKWELSAEEIAGAITDREYLGLCRACGSVAEGVEPDACGYQCHACERWEVYGLEELLIMGELDVEGEKS